jgi:UMF1 family MFS transporter
VSGAGPGRAQGASRRAVAAWCLFDWANSAYPTVVVTFVFAAYYTRAVAGDATAATGQWGQAIALSGLAVALLAPIFGAVADQTGRCKPWLGLFTVAAVAASFGLWTVAPAPGYALLALMLVAFGNAAFELGQVFYNAMLPGLAGPTRLGRISGWAWGLGYGGGLACLALSLLLFLQPDPPLFGLDAAEGEAVRIIGPFVGVWFAVFALPLFLFTPDTPPLGANAWHAARGALPRLWRTLRALPSHEGGVGRFLLARMIYTDGLNTLFAFGGLYAAGTFGMDMEEILRFGILLNVAAGAGAFGFAWIDDWIGARRTVLIALACLIATASAILLVESRTWFVVLGCMIGLFIGPAQSASRSFMARLAPPHLRSELFGLYALSGKATAFVGPALVAWVTLWSDSQRIGMATILGFFLVGMVLFWPLRDPDR